MRPENVPLFPMVCRCGHPLISHHQTPKRATWCSVHSPHRCGCTLYTPQEDEDDE